MTPSTEQIVWFVTWAEVTVLVMVTVSEGALPAPMVIVTTLLGGASQLKVLYSLMVTLLK